MRMGDYDDELREQIITQLETRVRELETVLCFYTAAFPAFRSKPVGAPGSIERWAQETHIEWETKAQTALSKPVTP